MSNVNPEMGAIVNCDVLVVGAGEYRLWGCNNASHSLITVVGFGGVYAIHKLRKLGLNVKCFEAGSSLGGVWYWNR